MLAIRQMMSQEEPKLSLIRQEKEKLEEQNRKTQKEFRISKESEGLFNLSERELDYQIEMARQKNHDMDAKLSHIKRKIDKVTDDMALGSNNQQHFSSPSKPFRPIRSPQVIRRLFPSTSSVASRKYHDLPSSSSVMSYNNQGGRSSTSITSAGAMKFERPSMHAVRPQLEQNRVFTAAAVAAGTDSRNETFFKGMGNRPLSPVNPHGGVVKRHLNFM